MFPWLISTLRNQLCCKSISTEKKGEEKKNRFFPNYIWFWPLNLQKRSLSLSPSHGNTRHVKACRNMKMTFILNNERKEKKTNQEWENTSQVSIITLSQCFRFAVGFFLLFFVNFFWGKNRLRVFLWFCLFVVHFIQSGFCASPCVLHS